MMTMVNPGLENPLVSSHLQVLLAAGQIISNVHVN